MKGRLRYISLILTSFKKDTKHWFWCQNTVTFTGQNVTMLQIGTTVLDFSSFLLPIFGCNGKPTKIVGPFF